MLSSRLYSSSSSLPGYYHLHPLSSSEYALSLSADPDRTPVGTSPTDAISATTFRPSTEFLALLHATLREYAHEDPSVQAAAAAAATGSTAGDGGYMHIGDERDPPAWGRIPAPEDIMGSVRVQRGEVVKGSYEPCDAYRVVTGSGGVMQLGDFLRTKLVQRL